MVASAPRSGTFSSHSRDKDMKQHESIWQDLVDAEFSQGWRDVKGVRTRYLVSGASDKPALIFLHGSAGHAEAYSRNLKAHGEHFWTWSIDMLGHGWTDKPGKNIEIADYVGHLLDFIDSLNIERAHISGESLGGWVAAKFAAWHPDRVGKLVLNTMGGSKADPKVMETIRTLSMRAAEDPNWQFIKDRLAWLMADPEMVHDDLVACRQRIYAQPGFVAAMRDIMCLQDPEIRARNLITEDEFAAIAAPTLVLWTSHDPTADATEGRKIAARIKGAAFALMEGCGHWPQYEKPEEFNRIHLDFLLG